MPIYEYECKKCGHRFEVIQKVSDPPVNKCEKCKGKVERLISSPAIQFKGSGWYVTDYARKSSGPEPAKSESTNDTGTEKKTSSKKGKEKAGSSK